ncbi:MAG TPA: hypothetical protein PKN48_02855 [Bacteroidales bacterium]|nr:hypothetical protein [Bacteroidales bacterium]
MNKLIIFIFCYCPLYLFAQPHEVNFISVDHKSRITGTSYAHNYILSFHLFSTNLFTRTYKHKDFEKYGFEHGSMKSLIKHYPKSAFAKHRLSEKPEANPTNQSSEINKKMKKIFHSGKSQGVFSNNTGLNVIVGELSNVVEDGSLMPPSYTKVNKFVNSYPHNSLMGYLLGSVFTPSGFYIGLSVPVPYAKTGVYHLTQITQ